MNIRHHAVFLWVFVFIGFAFLVSPFFVDAQSSDSVEKRERELRKQLSVLEDEIAQQESILDARRAESVSLERDIAILDAEIQKARLVVQTIDLEIEQLTGEIGTKQKTIGSLSDKLSRERSSLAQLIRKTNEMDNVSLVEVVLGGEELSNVFEDLGAFSSIESELQFSFREIEDTRDTTRDEKEVLEDRRIKEEELRGLKVLEQQRIEVQEAEKQRLLDISRGIEAQYQLVLTQKEQNAAQIRAELFKLRGSAAIPFGEALDLANAASVKTGVRPALILGVIEQETKLGENIGNCNLPDDPPEYKWYNIMKEPRDTVPYLDITKRLGLDPEAMPLSCPPGYGYGGAMGPAQFIPSTWVLFEDRISNLTGNKPPNPWAPEDAFMASALLLKDNGADRGGFTAERLAALRYFAGWSNADNPSYAFYGDSVMGLATKNQNLIDQLN